MLYICGLLTALTLILAIRQHPPANVANYLIAVLWEIPFLWVYKWEFGDESWEYASAYCLLIVPILYAIGRITADSLKGRQFRARAAAITLILALCLARIASSDLHGQYAWISLGQGFLLMWFGSLTAFAGAYRPRRDLYFALGCFWTCQAIWNFGWSIKWQEWADLNWILPPLMAMCCFGFLAWRLSPRQKHPEPLRDC